MSTLIHCPLDMFLQSCLRWRDQLHIVLHFEEFPPGLVNVRAFADSIIGLQQDHEPLDDAHCIVWYVTWCGGQQQQRFILGTSEEVSTIKQCRRTCLVLVTKDSSGCRHGVAGCTVLLQSLDVLFLCARHEMLAGMILLSLLSQSRLAQVLALNHSLAASPPVFSVPSSLCGDHQTSPLSGLHRNSLATSTVSAWPKQTVADQR